MMNGVFVGNHRRDDLCCFRLTQSWFATAVRMFRLKSFHRSFFPKPANLLKSILVKETGSVNVEFDSKNARFTMSGYTLVCRLVEGNTPTIAP